MFLPNKPTATGYTGSLVDKRLTAGYCTYLGGNLVTWRSEMWWQGHMGIRIQVLPIIHGLCKCKQLWLITTLGVESQIERSNETLLWQQVSN